MKETWKSRSFVFRRFLWVLYLSLWHLALQFIVILNKRNRNTQIYHMLEFVSVTNFFNWFSCCEQILKIEHFSIFCVRFWSVLSGPSPRKSLGCHGILTGHKIFFCYVLVADRKFLLGFFCEKILNPASFGVPKVFVNRKSFILKRRSQTCFGFVTIYSKSPSLGI